jgi:hypothetical protein
MPAKENECIRQKAYFAKVLAPLGSAAQVRLEAETGRVSRRRRILKTSLTKAKLTCRVGLTQEAVRRIRKWVDSGEKTSRKGRARYEGKKG